MTAPEQVASQRTGPEKAASPTAVPQDPVVFQVTGPEKAAFRKIVPGKEALAQSDLLTENRAEGPADSVMAISLFSATVKVPVRIYTIFTR